MANIFFDDFNRADNTSLGANWSEVAGDLEIISNTVQNRTAVEAVATYTGTITPSDYSVSTIAQTVTGTSNNAGIIGRYVDINNFYYLRILQGTGFQLFKKVGGATTQLGSTYSTTITNGVPHTIKLEMIGSTINGYYDDVLRITVTDTAFASAGKAGIRINNGLANSGQVDDFSIDEIPAGTSTNGGGGISSILLLLNFNIASGGGNIGASSSLNLSNFAYLLEDGLNYLLTENDSKYLLE